MEHLDLAGYQNTPITWNLSSFDQQDAIYLSNSRQMLEPIMEETSEDEEHALNSWNQFEQLGKHQGGGNGNGFWSSAESETGSVIRVEVNKDLDAISERDFACPPKRARRSIDDQQLPQQQPHSLEDCVQLRRPIYADTHSSLERFLALEACARDSYGSTHSQPPQRNSTGSRRFEEYYSDNDSYHSLSRSSSLVQFESLERQLTLQEQHQSMNSLGNSSPSLLSSCEVASAQASESNSACNSGNNSRRGSQNSLMKRYESSDGRLHQTYYELNKLSFGDEDDERINVNLFTACKGLPINGSDGCGGSEIKSDSESSSSSDSSSSSGHSILSTSKPNDDGGVDAANELNGTLHGTHRTLRCGKNSVENLSEDSGYCEPSTLRRAKSKSIPKNFDKFCEEEEEEQLQQQQQQQQQQQLPQQLPLVQSGMIDAPPHSKNSNSGHDLCQPKITANVATFLLESRVDVDVDDDDDDDEDEEESPSSQSLPINSDTRETHSPSPVSSDISTGSSGSSSCSSAASFTWLPKSLPPMGSTSTSSSAMGSSLLAMRNSLPDIREVCGSGSENSDDKLENSRHTSGTSSSGCGGNSSSGSLCLSLQRCRGDVNHSYGLASTTKKTKATSDSSSSSTCSSANNSPRLGGGRNASVPNELHQLGRRRQQRHRVNNRPSKSSTDEIYSSSDDADERADFFDLNSSLTQIRRSCSWSERRAERGNSWQHHKFEGAFGGGGGNETNSSSAAAAGYLNASYQNLTLLDYTGKEPTSRQLLEANHKRGGSLEEAEEMANANRSCNDYEDIICKGNFLLDELSQIYDKNASILNDRPIEEQQKALQECEEDEEVVEVQHVQLTIRNPPPPPPPSRPKRDANQRRSQEVIIAPPPPEAAVISFSTFGKTFDQDPTNLRTSYAQSLEKCNFDPMETSQMQDTTDSGAGKSSRSIPKRRFQSRAASAKQRNLVSSTPNLSSYDGRGDEMEDDIYVSSAHNSMHQLPQSATPKPLGILLPTGSRTSFNKEVSFCPVVSKYCWQEQSSEEPQEDHDDGETKPSDGQQEEDELLDNSDATVIFNTKENENIAARYIEEQAKREQQELRERDQQQQQQQQVQSESESEQTIDAKQQQQLQQQQLENIAAAKSEESDDNNENIADVDVAVGATASAAAAAANAEVSVAVAAATHDEKPVSSASNTTAVSLESNRVAAVTPTATSVASPSVIAPTSTNSTTTTSNPDKLRPLSLHLPILSEPPINRAHHILYASQQLLDRYERNADPEMSTTTTTTVTTTKAVDPEPPTTNKGGNRSHKSDEKHPSSKGFLSRFAHGLRFSLRRKKKQQQTTEQPKQQQQQQPASPPSKPSKNNNNNNNTSSNSSTTTTNNKKSNGKKSQDFIYIPLKGPLPSSANANVSNASSTASTASVQSTGHSKQNTVQSPNKQQQPLVTGKPPLPKQPPRSIAVAAVAGHAQCGTPAASAANGGSAALLEAERRQYADFAQQLTSGTDRAMQQYAENGNDSSSPSRASVSQKTQMFNQLSGGHPRPTMVTAVPVQVALTALPDAATAADHHKIGLIETNLDTHETVISGKTRSLMDINQHPHQRYIVKRLNATTSAYGDPRHIYDDDDDDVGCHHHHHDDDDDDNDGGGGRIKNSSQAGGVQIASVRRPHKSMEFLLDKENQKNILPPENELQKSHEHNPAALSEHQLRVQASLQRLNIPDWFRQYNQSTARSPDGTNAGGTATGTTTATGGYRPGNFARKRAQESGRWQGLNSKTTSLSSLGSQRSDRSPLLLSPSAHSHHGGQSSVGPHYTTQTVSGASSCHHNAGGAIGGATRWSTSHLNSTQTSPSVSQRGSFARGAPINSSFISVNSGNSGGVLRNSYRQPYLGWRSTEKLSQRTPHERLANSLLAQQQQQQQQQQQLKQAQPQRTNGVANPEIQSSIKEVTSAIVHYVNDQQQQQQHSRSASPNSRKCWLESSFVGIRPLDSPQTPVIDSSTSTTTATTAGGAPASQHHHHSNNTNIIISGAQQQQQLHYHPHQQQQPQQQQFFGVYSVVDGSNLSSTSTQQQQPPPLRMNGLSRIGGGGAPERSLSNASLEDVLASLLGLPTTSTFTTTTTTTTTISSNNININNSNININNKKQTQAAGVAGSSTTADTASQKQQQQQQQLDVLTAAEQQRLRRRSEGDAPAQKKQQQQQLQHQQQLEQQDQQKRSTGAAVAQHKPSNAINDGQVLLPRRVSLGDSTEPHNTNTNNSSNIHNNNNNQQPQINSNSVELQIKCRNTKCDNSATPADAKKLYKSCHNCTHLYCSRECRRAHWEKHRKACLHSRASNLCRQVLATCKDDIDSQRHLSLLARKGSLSQGRGVVRVLFRSAEAAEGFIKHGFQCMGEASYVRWPDLMPAEMGLELYSELLKLSTEYKPESKMLIYVAICVVSEAPGMGQAPVRWERQLVSRCAKLKLCKSILAELELQQQALQQQQQQQPPLSVVAVPERTEILILTFNPGLRATVSNRELILSNILDILSRRGVLLRKHYPEIYQRLQTYTEGQTDKFNPVTLHPRDSQTGQSFVCIIMPVHTDSEVIKLPSAADGGNRVTTIDVGSPAALAQLDDDELLTRTAQMS